MQAVVARAPQRRARTRRACLSSVRYTTRGVSLFTPRNDAAGATRRPLGHGNGALTLAEPATLAEAVEQLTSVCAALLQRFEADRIERRALIDALQRLTTTPATHIDVRESAWATVEAAPAAEPAHRFPAFGTPVWDRFENLRGGHIRVDELVVTRLDRGTRLTRRASRR